MMMRGSSPSSSAHRSFVFLLCFTLLSLPLIDGVGITTRTVPFIVRGGGNAETLRQEEEPEDALDHRQRGLQLYQEQSYIEAAKAFHLAAENSTSPDEGNDDDAYATLKLHEALCYLQAEQYDAVISICTSLLEHSDKATYSTAIRARAYYRRAKAYHQQQDEEDHSDQVLADARSAAFLGDKKAVAFYGQLMRSSGGDATESSSTAAATTNPFVSASSMPGINPLSSFSAPPGTSNSASSLVQSVLKSLLKRIDDRATQEQICHYLQTQTSAAQLQQYGALVGLHSVPASVWERLVGICHGMSLPRLRRLVFCTKGVAFTVQLGRKLLRLGQKYRTLITAGFLCGWIRSALRRPLPISKRRRRQLAANAATANGASLLRQ